MEWEYPCEVTKITIERETRDYPKRVTTELVYSCELPPSPPSPSLSPLFPIPSSKQCSHNGDVIIDHTSSIDIPFHFLFLSSSLSLPSSFILYSISDLINLFSLSSYGRFVYPFQSDYEQTNRLVTTFILITISYINEVIPCICIPSIFPRYLQKTLFL